MVLVLHFRTQVVLCEFLEIKKYSWTREVPSIFTVSKLLEIAV